MIKNCKVIVFDLDETLGYFTEFGIFCDCIDSYLNEDYSKTHFNELLDLYPEFLRPKMIHIMNYLKKKKIENECYKVMIYTNNQGDESWAKNIIKYIEHKIEYQLFDKIIAAYKVGNRHVELRRTSHDKTIDDFYRCTDLTENVKVCFIDDLFHSGMVDDNVYYIHVKRYHYDLSIDDMINAFLDSNMGHHIQDKEDFINSVNRDFKKYKYNVSEKTVEEQDIDQVIGKRLLQHIKQFFNEKTNKTVRNKKNEKKKESSSKTAKRKLTNKM